MRVAMTKASLLVPPTYFALAHPLALADRFEFRYFTGASEIADPGAAHGIAIDDTVDRVVPLAARLPIRRREQLGALLTPSTARAITRFEPDVIHQHFAYGSRAAVSAARRGSVPLLVTVHGGDAFVPLTPPSARRPLGRPAVSRMQHDIAAAYRDARRILAVSDYIAGIAVQGGADPARVDVHYQGVDTDYFTPGDAASGDATSGDATVGDVPTVLFVGRLTETKGVFDLLEASLGVVDERPHTLVFAGDGPARARLAEAASTAGHVRVRGSLPHEAVRDELRAAHVMVLPTRVNGIAREAAGLVLVEAQACGTPVIAYDSGGTAEMLRDGETGWLVPEGDTTHLAERLGEALALTPSARIEMGVRARRFAVEERSLAVSADRLATVYEEVA